jgi:Uma2 family endonuclease
MSIAPPSSSNVAIAPPVPMRRWTVDEYHQLINAGVFDHDEKFELLEGWIVPKISGSPPHAVALDLTQEQLRSRLPFGWRLRIQSAITTADSEPEPDIAIVRGSARDYSSGHPEPQDIALVIEVAERSLPEDRRDKARIYARAGIAIYWIINLIDSQVEVYSDPTGDAPATAYRARAVFAPTDSVELIIAGQPIATLAVRELLP